MRASFAVLAAAAATLVAGQETTPLPALSAPPGMACGGCYIVADVAGAVFGTEATTIVQTVVVGQGPNGTSVTQTVTSTAVTAFTTQTGGNFQATFTNGAPVQPGLQTIFTPFGTTVNVGGATLTSPTAYEVFTAYTLYSTTAGPDGACSTGATAVQLGPAIAYAVPSGAGPEFILQAESQFIARIVFPSTCSSSLNQGSTIFSQATTTTETTSATGILSPQPASTTETVASNTFNYSFPSPTIFPAINQAPQLVPSVAYSALTLGALIGALAYFL